MADNRSDGLSALLGTLRERFALFEPPGADPLALVEASGELHELADRLTALTVEAARDSGAGWEQIGEALGLTAPAAFQRFGRPVDPRTGRAMDVEPLEDAGPRALSLIDRIVTADFAATRADFDPTMLRKLSERELGDNWAQAISLVGDYRGAGCPRTRRRGRHTVVDTPLTFEAGELTARIAFDGDGRVAGLFFLDPEYARRH